MAKKKYRRLTPDTLMEIAGQYKTKREFYDADPSAFVSAGRRKVMVHKKTGQIASTDEALPKKDFKEISLLDHVCAHMYRQRFRWTKAMIAGIAQNYQTRGAFASGDKAAYSAAIRQGILDEVCAHMSLDKRVRWTDSDLKKLSEKFTTVEEFQKSEPKAFKAAQRRNLLTKLFSETAG